MRLIDADALIATIVNTPTDMSGYNPVYCNGVATRQNEILDIISELPTAYDVEAVVDELKNASYQTDSTFDEDGYCNDDSEEVVELHTAIEIVRGKG